MESHNYKECKNFFDLELGNKDKNNLAIPKSRDEMTGILLKCLDELYHYMFYCKFFDELNKNISNNKYIKENQNDYFNEKDMGIIENNLLMVRKYMEINKRIFIDNDSEEFKVLDELSKIVDEMNSAFMKDKVLKKVDKFFEKINELRNKEIITEIDKEDRDIYVNAVKNFNERSDLTISKKSKVIIENNDYSENKNHSTIDNGNDTKLRLDLVKIFSDEKVVKKIGINNTSGWFSRSSKEKNEALKNLLFGIKFGTSDLSTMKKNLFLLLKIAMHKRTNFFTSRKASTGLKVFEFLEKEGIIGMLKDHETFKDIFKDFKSKDFEHNYKKLEDNLDKIIDKDYKQDYDDAIKKISPNQKSEYRGGVNNKMK